MRFRSLLLIILFLIVLGGHCYGEIPKRKLGLGYRIGYIYDESSFGGVGQEYISYTPEVNYIDGVRIPFFLQLGGTLGPFNFDEDIFYNSISSGWFFDYRQNSVANMPPVLKGINYSKLIAENSSSGDISIKSSQTFIQDFSNRFSQYSTVINALSEPSLSADFSVSNILFGKSFGVFIPSKYAFLFAGDAPLGTTRFISLRTGLGIALTSGHYKVNLCDPYVISGSEVGQSIAPSFRRGSCYNKMNLYSQNLSNIGFSYYYSAKFMTYFSEDFEVNFIEYEKYQITPFQINDSDNNVITPKFGNYYLNMFSIIYRL